MAGQHCASRALLYGAADRGGMDGRASRARVLERVELWTPPQEGRKGSRTPRIGTPWMPETPRRKRQLW